MAPDLAGSQISALLETVPGIASVLRSPVADAMMNMIRAAMGTGEFRYEDAEELVQYAVRRGLVGGAEGERILQEACSAKKRSGRKAAAKRGGPRPSAHGRAHARRPPKGPKKRR